MCRGACDWIMYRKSLCNSESIVGEMDFFFFVKGPLGFPVHFHESLHVVFNSLLVSFSNVNIIEPATTLLKWLIDVTS